MKIGKCPKCQTDKVLTRHHIYPRRHFGKYKDNNEVILLCRECHRQLERHIPYQRVEDCAFYINVLNWFLRTERM